MADKNQQGKSSSGQEKIDGVDISNPSSRRYGESYRESDIAEIYKDAHPTSWQDLLNYVEKKGDATWHITPGEAIAIKQDIQRVMKSGNKSFPNNPKQAFQELSSQGMGGNAHHDQQQQQQQHHSH